MYFKKILFSLIFMFSLNCGFAQLKGKDSYISAGTYGLWFPVENETFLILGGLLDVPLKNYRKLYSSSSINFSSRINNYLSLQHISLTTGISWAFQNDEICLRPGIQVGYLNISHLRTSSFYSFKGLLGRTSAELTYLFNKIEVGMHINLGMAYGITDYNLSLGNSTNAFELTGGIGIACKYRFGRRNREQN